MLSSEPGSASRRFFYASLFWLLVPGVLGLILATFLYLPAVQDYIPLAIKPTLSFGRLRPTHVNLAVFGWLSQAYIGGIYFILPRLTRARLYSERLAHANWWLWNLMVAGALVTLPLGQTQGREYAEMAWPLDLLLVLNMLLLMANIWGTIVRRKEPKVYVSLWNFVAGTMIMLPVYMVGNKIWDPAGAYTGMNDNIVNYFYVHNLFNAWFTTVGIGLALYLLPKLTDKPLYSHGLALWGLWSVWTGQHHQLYSPAPDWLEYLTVVFSMLAAVPTTAFMVNFFMTMRGRWPRAGQDVALRFFATGAIFWALTCVQGVAQSFRNFSLHVHLTNWVVGHSHLAFVADYSFWAFALVYLAVPELMRRPIYSRRLMEWHYWLTTLGMVVFMVALWAAGLIQGQNWLTNSIPFLETVRSLQPYFAARLLGGLAAGAGILCFVYNVWQTARQPAAEPAVQPVLAVSREGD
ncbi:MAG: cbb3-type cytochrome c oxidase subunit I [Chloroflexi bacterium]|nr:cbb3-type cytochrome c oxidase subunit I [Chloroflexota bacterium]MCI0575093.1 cbb3-type cytochrome c oxidase subunit I [Chloroflexota bacterium]MCI0648205.1 cbb3-type cytochrome c oxidase subunit I [Chloroflexota bacterium]MCI0730144.1 cbb3-type cytochrome c oxidase subunit I [Chloroflexota bacterium]